MPRWALMNTEERSDKPRAAAIIATAAADGVKADRGAVPAPIAP